MLGFSLFSFKPVLVGGEGEISFQFPSPLLQSRAALGEREALKHSGQADFSGSSPPPPTPAPPPHDWGVGMEGGVGAHPTGRDSRWRDTEEEVGKKGNKKRAPRRAEKSNPLSPLKRPRSRWTRSFKPGSPRRAAPGPRWLGWLSRPAAGRSAPRLTHAVADAAEQRNSGRSLPAVLNYSWGVYYIRSHKLEPLCNAIRERYPHPLLLSPVLARSEPLQRLGSHFLCHLASSRGVLLRKQK